ncbi:MAG: hypothetical protein AAGU11_19435, partial [Syntrophobacteraceae bacterium]
CGIAGLVTGAVIKRQRRIPKLIAIFIVPPLKLFAWIDHLPILHSSLVNHKGYVFEGSSGW